LEKSLESELQKHIPLPEEQHRFKKLLTNNFICALSDDDPVQAVVRKAVAGWEHDYDRYQHIYMEFLNHASTRKFLSKESPTEEDFKTHLQHVIRYFINESELFGSIYEDTYMNWADDKPVVLANVLKYINGLDSVAPETPSKNSDWDEISDFGEELLRKTLSKDSELKSIIASHCKNWDTERMAMTDTILIAMCICEFMHFESIPVKVSMNEYIELAKLYSTPNSGKFLNGVLDSILKDLKKNNQIQKKGMGLVGN
jgi:N utilization substance protein B